MALFLAAPAAAQASAQSPVILIAASGTVATPPDRVGISFTLRGEGASSDAAVQALKDKAALQNRAIRALLGGDQDTQSSAFSIAQVRSSKCTQNGYGPQQLSTGDCAVIGYVATMPVSIETSRIKDAGTLVSVIGRNGGVDSRINGFSLHDPAPARRQAMQAALRQARDQAQQIAEGSGGHLGSLLRLQDADYREATIDMANETTPPSQPVAPPPPPPPPPPPVRIDLAPPPIETTVRIMASYAIAP